MSAVCASIDWLQAALADEAVKVPKLEIIFGSWWRHYATPYEFRWTLYLERPACLYCGGSIGQESLSASMRLESPPDGAELDHMDPIARGGEDALRNADNKSW